MRINALPALTERESRRFWDGVDTQGADDCWPWTRYAEKRGYGQIGITRDGKTRLYFVHRVAYALARGGVPEGAVVMHRCDNPRCCNPAHLAAGTSAANTADMLAKGRGRPRQGSAHPAAKLTEADVARIKRATACRAASHAWLAWYYDVSQPLITNIANGKAWAHVSGDVSATPMQSN